MTELDLMGWEDCVTADIQMGKSSLASNIIFQKTGIYLDSDTNKFKDSSKK